MAPQQPTFPGFKAMLPSAWTKEHSSHHDLASACSENVIKALGTGDSPAKVPLALAQSYFDTVHTLVGGSCFWPVDANWTVDGNDSFEKDGKKGTYSVNDGVRQIDWMETGPDGPTFTGMRDLESATANGLTSTFYHVPAGKVGIRWASGYLPGDEVPIPYSACEWNSLILPADQLSKKFQRLPDIIFFETAKSTSFRPLQIDYSNTTTQSVRYPRSLSIGDNTQKAHYGLNEEGQLVHSMPTKTGTAGAVYESNSGLVLGRWQDYEEEDQKGHPIQCSLSTCYQDGRPSFRIGTQWRGDKGTNNGKF